MNSYLKLNVGMEHICVGDLDIDYDEGLAIKSVDSTQWLSPEFYERLSGLMYKIEPQFMLFRTKPLGRSWIHVDQGTNGDCWAINFVWNSQNHRMIWFEPLVEKTEVEVTQGHTYYNRYDISEVKPLCVLSDFSTAVLVRHDQPHQVVNMDPVNNRYCLSVRGKIEPQTWPEIVEYFAQSGL